MTRRQEKRPAEAADPFHQYSQNVNQALHEWTEKVDTKASVVLTLETATFGAVLAFSSNAKPLGHLSGALVGFYRLGIVFLIGAILCAGVAVFPQLNRRDARRNWKNNHVYFGHLRRWEPKELITAVRNNGNDGMDLIMGVEIVALSKIVWRKHALLQWSMSLELLGASCVGMAALFH